MQHQVDAQCHQIEVLQQEAAAAAAGVEQLTLATNENGAVAPLVCGGLVTVDDAPVTEGGCTGRLLLQLEAAKVRMHHCPVQSH